MGVPPSEVGYTSATTGRGDHEVHNGHVVALGKREREIEREREREKKYLILTFRPVANYQDYLRKLIVP
jgi:hypothetical protein